MRALMEKLAERMELPEELLDGVSRLTMLGRREVRIEQYDGILSFSQELFEVRSGETRLRIRGAEMRIVSLDAEGLVVRGSIDALETEQL